MTQISINVSDPNLADKLDKGNYTGTASDLKSDLENHYNTESVVKLDKGDYNGNASDLQREIQSIKDGMGSIYDTPENAVIANPTAKSNTAFRVKNNPSLSIDGDYIFDDTKTEGYTFIGDILAQTIEKSNTTQAVSGKGVHKAIVNATNTFDVSDNTFTSANQIFDLIQDIYIYDATDPLESSNYGLGYVWLNRLSIGSNIGRIGFQIRVNGTKATNFGIPMSVSINDLEKLKIIEANVQSTAQELAHIRVFLILKNVTFPSDDLFIETGYSYSIFKESSKSLNSFISLIDTKIEEKESITLLERDSVQSVNESVWKSHLKNFWIIDLERQPTDTYKVSYCWANHESLGKFGLQILKNDTNNSNFTINENINITPNSTVQIPVQNTNQPLLNVIVIAEFSDFTEFTKESFLENLEVINMFDSGVFDLENIYRKQKIIIDVSENILEVGTGKKYTFIQDAIDDSVNGNFIKIYPGTYNEALKNIEDTTTNRVVKLITMFGLDKYTTIITTKTGDYKSPPLECAGGLKCYNLTFLADDSELDMSNPPANFAYAVHMDYYGSGTTEFANCIVNSKNNAAFGVGLHSNQTLKLMNNDVKAIKGKSDYSSPAVYFHNSPNNEFNQKLVMRGNYLDSDYIEVFTVDDARLNNNGIDQNTTIELINNTFVSAISGVSESVFVASNAPVDGGISGRIKLTITSHGNNISVLNSI